MAGLTKRVVPLSRSRLCVTLKKTARNKMAVHFRALLVHSISGSNFFLLQFTYDLAGRTNREEEYS